MISSHITCVCVCGGGGGLWDMVVSGGAASMCVVHCEIWWLILGMISFVMNCGIWWLVVRLISCVWCIVGYGG